MTEPTRKADLPVIRLKSDFRGSMRLLLPVLALMAWVVWQYGRFDAYTWWMLGGLAVLIPLSFVARVMRPTTLTLDADGFTLQPPWSRPFQGRWQDIEKLGLISGGRGVVESVGVNFKPGRTFDPSPGFGTGQRAKGYDRWIVNVFDPPTEELLVTMQRYQCSAAGPEAM